MMTDKVPLLIPVENQVRELDPKLLLACIAARRGFPSYIGSRREIHFRITSFPRGIYLSKSITAASEMMFQIMRCLGHEVVAWDEEALVHLPPQTYYSRRLSPVAMAYVSHFFAWGEDNAELWRQYPQLPKNAKIHATGNPRNDLLRPELHAYYDAEVEKIQQAYGNFILVNTNFNHVNAFSAVQNLFQPARAPGEQPRFGRAAKGMTREYAEGLRDHKQAVFEDFKRLIPDLEKVFPDYTATISEDYDYGFYRLPNLLSHQCFNFEELRETLAKILAGKLGAADGNERKILVDQYLAALDGPLACERMLDVVEMMVDSRPELPKPHSLNRLYGRSLATGRTLVKRCKSYLPGSHNKPKFQRHRYPEISLEEVRARIFRFQQILGHSEELKVVQIAHKFFKISF
jgi:surface carbohydrate biosynthesis protein